MNDQAISRTIFQILVLLLLLTGNGCSSKSHIDPTKTGLNEPSGAVLAAAVPQASETPSAAFSTRLREIEQSGRLAGVDRGNFSDYKKHFTAIYESTNFGPLWLRNGQPTPQALGAIEAIRGSQQKGLSPADYFASSWQQRVEALKTATDAQWADFDAALSVAVMRYISDLHIGRVNPKHFNFGIDVEAKKYDLPHFITQEVVNAPDVRRVLAQVEPPYNGYRRTEEALDHYLALESKGDGPTVPDVAKSVGIGDAYAGVEALVARLRMLGDMPEGGELTAYDASVAEGVKHFQQRHGLNDDGKLGMATVRALNVPIASRVKQLAYALERWRWMPPEYPQPPVLVNIPEFRLRAFEGGEKVALAMNVVVGKAAPTQTPVFTDTIQYIVFRPYWNVPPSIVRSSVIPGFNRSGSAYLDRERFEVTGAGGGIPADLVAGLRSGKYGVRQKPGPKNSLGLIKFIFPNSNNVYLHSTPATQLFSQSRRDFSHGCIRLEKPADLAVFLLRNQDGGKWTLDRVQQTMDTGKDNQQVNLAARVPVLLLYVTAVVEEDGTVHFFDDIYGHDRKLDAVLAKGPPYP